MNVQAELVQRAREAFDRRREVTAALGSQAPAIAETCHQMARRFVAGGTILAFGNGGPTTDAQHVAVEFVHPVIVGKRALPALSLNADAASVAGLAHRHGPEQVYAHLLGVLGRSDDIAVGLSSDGRCTDVLAGLEAAHRDGMLTVALVGDPSSPIATSPAVDHVITVASDDPATVKEVHTTAYHVLWELVHVFFEHRGLLDDRTPAPLHDAGDSGFLYPFLAEDEHDLDAVLADVRRSILAKADDLETLRRRTLESGAGALRSAAATLQACFDGGGRLLAFGNGGSATDATDVVADFRAPPQRWPSRPALDLAEDPAILSALANDIGTDAVFARQLAAYGRRGDVALAFSTSGDSRNVVRGLEEARRHGIHTLAMVGYDGGRIAAERIADHIVIAPSQHIPRIQEAHATAYHCLRELVEPTRSTPPPS